MYHAYNQNFRRQNNSGGYRGNYRNNNYERCRNRSRERSYSGNFRRNDRSDSNSRSRSASRASSNRDRIMCYKCREYFAKNCPTVKEERDTDQIQRMFNLDEDQTSLKTLATDTHDNHNHVSSVEEVRSEYLNLYRGRMSPPHFYL